MSVMSIQAIIPIKPDWTKFDDLPDWTQLDDFFLISKV